MQIQISRSMWSTRTFLASASHMPPQCNSWPCHQSTVISATAGYGSQPCVGSVDVCFWWGANVTANSAWPLFSPASLMAGSRPKAAKWRANWGWGWKGKWMTFIHEMRIQQLLKKMTWYDICMYDTYCTFAHRFRVIAILSPIRSSKTAQGFRGQQHFPVAIPAQRGAIFLRVLPGAWPCDPATPSYPWGKPLHKPIGGWQMWS